MIDCLKCTRITNKLYITSSASILMHTIAIKIYILCSIWYTVNIEQTLTHNSRYIKGRMGKFRQKTKKHTIVTEIALLLPNNHTIAVYLDSGMLYKYFYSLLCIY